MKVDHDSNQQPEMIAAAQVALMVTCAIATMFCGLSFVILTGVVIMIGFGLFFIVWPEGSDTFLGVAAVVGLLVAWIIACRGIIVGMKAVYDPSLKASVMLAGHAVIPGCAWLWLFSGFW